MNIEGINNKLVNNNLRSAQAKAADDSFEKRLQSAVDAKDSKELRKVCKEYEAIFLNMMYKQMRASVPKADLMPEDAGREIYESMLDENLMDEASKGKSLGLADMLYKQMSRNLKAKESDAVGDSGVGEKK